MYNAAKKLIARYLGEYREDLERIWVTERPFELHLDGGTVSGRADVILDREGGRPDHLAIVDYRTAQDTQVDDVFAFQLAIYTAAGRGEGLQVDAAYLHQLKDGVRRAVAVDETATAAAKTRAEGLIQGLRERSFAPRPERVRCRQCDARAICVHAACSKVDRLGE
jgi:DNA helicase-2/ATP-dependent DNA helicase PcrA